ncbi:MAG: peptidoglycan DD-metalloendopeptidase family protein [Neisseriaceae bacterium]|nr:peptidoglycan DD-metalloendopeptidase family protein [Neisseriaceae bacterium]MBP6861472.1 peptidoglycan DD-metalloendopeptidase family protein [Neisseriaceae bacterium]
MLFAAPEGSPEALKETQAAIEAAQKAIIERQQAQKTIQKSLTETAAQIKQHQGEYERLNQQHQVKWAEAKALQEELNILRLKAQDNSAQLSRLLNAYYKNRYPEAVILLLNNDDPNKKGRNLRYMQYLVDADKTIIKALRQQQQKIAVQQAEVNAELKKLETLVSSKNKVLGKLKEQGSSANSASQKIDADIQRQTDRIKELRGDERRLNNIITALAQKRAAEARTKALAEQAAKKAAEQKAAEQKAAQARQLAEAQKKAAAKKLSDASTVEPKPITTVKEPPVVVAEKPVVKPAEPAVAKKDDFSRKQGQIQLPVSGKVAGRYGTAKPSGGSWKGIFISTAPQGVAVVASGEVAYANDLQGYGQTVIVDHGNNYLSVYTGLSQISVSVGQQLNQRQRIGVSGTLASGETGLYFEIRYLSQAINPLTWTN